jgi:mono/diheme cytochrome c family protein
VQYVKSFSPRWRRGERAGRAIEISADPWGQTKAQAIERGEALYHSEAGCVTCHPAHLPPSRLGVDLRADASAPRVTDSIYGPLAAIDLATGPLRMGDAPEDLYRVIAAGIGGTAMPTWKGALPEADLWALVHYIRSLRTAADGNAG